MHRINKAETTMKLLEPFQLGSHTLKNRMVMAAMTRSRADVNGIVGAMTAEFRQPTHRHIRRQH